MISTIELKIVSMYFHNSFQKWFINLTSRFEVIDCETPCNLMIALKKTRDVVGIISSLTSN